MNNEFDKKREEIKFKKEFLEMLKNELNEIDFGVQLYVPEFKNIELDKKTSKKILKKIEKYGNIYPDLCLEIIERKKWIIKIHEGDRNIILINMNNFADFRKEIEKDERELREEELKNIQLDFVKTEKNRNKWMFILTTVIAFGAFVDAIAYYSPGFAFTGSLIILTTFYILFLISNNWNNNKNKISKKIIFTAITVICLIIIWFGLILSIGFIETKLNSKPQRIEISNINQYNQNQKQIIDLLNESNQLEFEFINKTNYYEKEIENLKNQNENILNLLNSLNLTNISE